MEQMTIAANLEDLLHLASGMLLSQVSVENALLTPMVFGFEALCVIAKPSLRPKVEKLV